MMHILKLHFFTSVVSNLGPVDYRHYLIPLSYEASYVLKLFMSS